MQELKKLYSARQTEFKKELDKVNSSLRTISLVRIFVALLFLFLTYLGLNDSTFFFSLPVAGAVFIYLVNRYNANFRKGRLLENLVKLSELEIKSLDNDYANFQSGERFLDPHHPYSYDLDLFGNGSLFQYLNRCGSAIGENKLSELLLNQLQQKEDIYSRQEAAKDLRDRIQFRQEFWAHATLEKSSTFEIGQLLEWLRDKNIVEGKSGYQILLIAGPTITLLLAVATYVNSVWTPALLLAMSIQWAIVSFQSRKIKRVQDILGNQKVVLEKYAVLLNLLSRQDFKSALLASMQNAATEASIKMKEFSGLVNALESRMNAFASLFGNSLFLYDLHSIRRLERWRARNAADVPHWLETIADADALCAVSTFHFNNPTYCFPSIQDKLGIKAEAFGHPLIAAAERVNNDFVLGDPESIMIVTGAKIAGKSNIMRGVGVNVFMAFAGAPVCAKTFFCPILGLRSGMRTSDSLQEHQSYFYAELYRLQSIMEDLRSGKPLLILLDEILKGTNSTDKQSGSIAIVEQLATLDALVLLATHDVILGELQQRFSGKVTTGCFESQVDGAKLSFDYTLKPGVAQKANATFLMKQMGIIPT